MKFKVGDVVIKPSGGNKMTILNYINNFKVTCLWYGESFNTKEFIEEELILFSDYPRYLLVEKRDDIISKILN